MWTVHQLCTPTHGERGWRWKLCHRKFLPWEIRESTRIYRGIAKCRPCVTEDVNMTRIFDIHRGNKGDHAIQMGCKMLWWFDPDWLKNGHKVRFTQKVNSKVIGNTDIPMRKKGSLSRKCSFQTCWHQADKFEIFQLGVLTDYLSNSGQFGILNTFRSITWRMNVSDTLKPGVFPWQSWIRSIS